MGSQIKPDTLTPVSAFIHFSRLLLSRSSLDERRQSEEKNSRTERKKTADEKKKKVELSHPQPRKITRNLMA